MRAGVRRWFSTFAACSLTIFASLHNAHAQPGVDCEQAGRAAEQQYRLPTGLLLAIGRIESGRWDPALGHIAPWPWSVDIEGEGHQFDSSSEAISATRTAQTAGHRSVDVGCFQISLLHHPDAFPNLDQAFDPQVNAQYAARFLASLQVRLGSWEDAVAAYHSATRELGLPYRQRVFAAWSGGTSDNSPVTGREFPGFPGIRVWSPSPAGAVSEAVAIQTNLSQSLPNVITPTR